MISLDTQKFSHLIKQKLYLLHHFSKPILRIQINAHQPLLSLKAILKPPTHTHTSLYHCLLSSVADGKRREEKLSHSSQLSCRYFLPTATVFGKMVSYLINPHIRAIEGNRPPYADKALLLLVLSKGESSKRRNMLGIMGDYGLSIW